MSSDRAQYVERPADERLDDAKVAELWRGVERRRASTRHRRAPAMIGAALASAALTALVVWLVWPRGSSFSGATFVASGGAQRVRLGDGSTLMMDQGARLDVCKARGRDVCLSLRRGRVRFAVARDARRVFRVRAGGVDVRVVGTRFVVSRRVAGARREVSVAVEQGIVEVLGVGARARRLTAGQRVSVSFDAEGREVGRGRAIAPAGRRSPSPPPSPPQPAAKSPPPPSPQPQRAAKSPPPASSQPVVRPSSSHQAASTKIRRGANPPGKASRGGPAAQAWSRALAARRRGAHRAAARAFATIVSKHPTAKLAPLAAFELGRLRMDVLRDPAGAARAFEVALARGARSPYHEHALARLARLYDTLGKLVRCRARRAAYLKRYPNGVHASALARLCPDGR